MPGGCLSGGVCLVRCLPGGVYLGGVWGGVCPRGYLPQGCLPRGGCMSMCVCLGGCLPRGRGLPEGCTPPPLLLVNRMTDRCKNINFPQHRLRTVIQKVCDVNL